MKKLFLVIIAIIISANCFSQFVYKIKADSLLVTNDSCDAELILENSTRNVDGYLYNKGNGRTEFRSIFNKIDSITYVFGNDTVSIAPSFNAQNGVLYNPTTKMIEWGDDIDNIYYGPARQIRPTIYNQNSNFFNWIGGFYGIPTFSKIKYGDGAFETNYLANFYVARFAHQSQGGILFEGNHKNPTGYAAPTFWFGFKNHHPDAVKYSYFGDSLVASMTVGQRSATDGKLYSTIIFKVAGDTTAAEGDILTLVPPFRPHDTGKNGMRIPTTVTPRMSIGRRGPGIPAYDPTPLDDSNPYSRLVINAADEPLVFANLPTGDGYALVVDSTGKVRKNGSAYLNMPGATNNAYQSLTDSSTVIWNNAIKPNAQVTLGGNRTLRIDSTANGSKGKIIVKQDATGGRSLQLPSNSYFENGEAGITFTPTINAVDILSFEYDGSDYFWSVKRNFMRRASKFNFNETVQNVPGWLDVTGNPHQAIRTATDPVSGIGVSSIATTKWSGSFGGASASHGGETTANPSFAFDPTVTTSYWYMYLGSYSSSADCNVEINGLEVGESYKIEILASRDDAGVAASTRLMRVVCVHSGGESTVENFDAKANTANLITFDNKSPDSNGKIFLWVGRKTPADGTHQFGYINGLRITKL